MAMTADSLDKINFISNTMARFNLITLQFQTFSFTNAHCVQSPLLLEFTIKSYYVNTFCTFDERLLCQTFPR